MKTVTKILLHALFICACFSVNILTANAQNCPQNDYSFSSQAELNSFPQNCTHIVGDLSICCWDNDLDLSPLNNVTSIGGSLHIEVTVSGSGTLTDLSGLSNLQTVGGDFHILDMNVDNLDPLSNLTSIGGDLFLHYAIDDCCGIVQLTAIPGAVGGSIDLSGNCGGVSGINANCPLPDHDGDGADISQDCDDDDANNYPGNIEICDGHDNDCDSQVDEPGDCATPGTRTWVGLIDSDWNTACNWSPICVPTADDHVLIPDVNTNDPIIMSGTAALAQSVHVMTGAGLTIENTAGLTINGSAAYTSPFNFTAGLNNEGTVDNSGGLTLGSSASVGHYGIVNQATFNNTNGGDINIDRSTSTGLFNISGTFTNWAAITIGANHIVEGMGVLNDAIFNNNTGGIIAIEETDNDGLYNASGGTFTNMASISIGANKKVGSSGIYNIAIFNNNPGGEIKIDETGKDGIYCSNTSTFFNDAVIIVGANKKIGDNGIWNNGNFTNTTNGDIQIEEITDHGIRNWSTGSFTNNGTITIGANKLLEGFGIQNYAEFTNNAGAQIQIDNLTSSGIYSDNKFVNLGLINIGQTAGNIGNGGILNNGGTFQNFQFGEINIDGCTLNGIHHAVGTFTNGATITIGASQPPMGAALLNQAIFRNHACATLTCFKNLENTATFNQYGYALFDTPVAHTNSGFTNDGILIYPQGNPIPNVNNEEVIISPTTGDCSSINPTFDLGNTVNYNIVGIFTDPNASNSAGGYSKHTNIFTPNNPLSEALHSFYVKLDTFSSCPQVFPWTLTVDDITPPTFTCPANQIINSEPGACSGKVPDLTTLVNDESDNCGTPTLSQNFAANSSFGSTHADQIQVTITADDGNGNQNVVPCVVTLTLNDNEAPSAICPTSIPDVELDANGNGTLLSNIGDGSSTDNCSSPTETSPAANYTCANLGWQTVVLTAHDGNSNTDTEACTFKVVDNIAPVAVCPATIADVELDANGNGTLPANIGDGSSTDNCAANESSPAANFTCADIGGQTVVLTVDDGNGNSDTETCSFNVVDNIAPEAICPANIPDVELDANGNGTLPANIGDGSSTDNCAANESSPSASFTCADIGVQTVVLTVDDGNGNSDTETCSFNVVDNTVSEAICPANIPDVELDANGNGTLPANIGDGSSTDNCAVTETSPAANFTCADIGVQTVVLVVDDGNGNSDTEDCYFNVVDNIAPVAICPANIPDVELDANGNGTLPANIGDGSSTDNCAANESSTSANFTCVDIGVQTVVLSVDDGNGNSDTEACYFNVVDNIAPEAICPVNIPDVELDANGNGTLPANIGDGSSTDNCAANESSPSASFTCADIGVQMVVLTADDGNGNTNTETCSFNVVDNSDPAITCPANVTKECHQSTSSIWTGVAMANDNCSGAPAITESDISTQGNSGCDYYSYTITRTWTADDGNGNTASCEQIITVEDNAAPLIFCPADVTVECDADHSPSATGTASGVDNCDSQPTISSNDDTTSGSCANSWTITRTWNIADACGNSTPCDQVITVEDTTAPMITCPNDVTIECDQSTAPANTGSATALDNCDASPVISSSDATTGGSCTSASVITRTWSATDDCGNSSPCDQIITVEDSSGPMITCPTSVTVECDDDHSSTVQGSATANDNCSAVGDITITEADATAPGSCANAWTITRTWTAQDECGNTTSCDQIITVEDTTAPIMSCGSLAVTPNTDGTYTLSQSEIDGLGTGSTDNCGNITFSASPNTFHCANEGANSVTITGTDECGNSSSCSATVTLEEYLTIESCTATGEICAGAGDGSINISATALGGQVKYSVDGGANYSASGTFNNLTPGTYNIVVKVFGIAEICEKTDTKTVAAGGTAQTWYKDADGDGYSDGNTLTSCTQPTGYIASPLAGTDCNDSDPAINPGATETCDGLDNNCDGIIPADETDADGDGYMVCENDCDDTDPDVNPGATEICNGIDDDCDGEVDEGVGSGLTWTGNVTFTTQAEVDAWLACYSIIDGSLTIAGNNITDLSNLIGIEEVTGTVSIYYNSALTSLNGLDNLATVGGSLTIFYNFLLSDCCAIHDLINGGVTGSISIFFNAAGCNSVSEVNSNCGGNNLSQNPANTGILTFDEKDFVLYPNPTSGSFTVRIPQQYGTGQISVMDIHGREMMTQETIEGQATYLFEGGTLPTGIYMVVKKADGREVQVKRLVIE